MIVFMQNCKVLNNNKYYGLPGVQAIATSTKPKRDKHPITMHEFIQQKAEVSYYGKASSTVGIPGSTLNYDRIGLFVCTAPIDGAVQEVVPTSQITSFVSILLPKVGKISRLKTYVRLQAKWILFAIYGRWRLYYFEGL